MGLFSSTGDYYKSFTDARNKYIADRLGNAPDLMAPEYQSGVPEDVMAKYWQYQADYKRLQDEWLKSLDPTLQAQATQSFADHNAGIQRTNKIGSGLAKGIVAGIAGAGALSELGLLGGGGASPYGMSPAQADSALAAFDAAVPSSAIDAAIKGSSGLLGMSPDAADAALAAFDSAVPSSTIDAAVKAAGGGLSSLAAPSLPGSTGLLSGLPGGLGNVLGSIPTNALLSGAAGLASGIGAAMSDNGGGSGSSAGTANNTHGVGLTFGTLQQSQGTPWQQAMNPAMAPSKYANSGLGRFGPGLFNPDPYTPTNYFWGK